MKNDELLNDVQEYVVSVFHVRHMLGLTGFGSKMEVCPKEILVFVEMPLVNSTMLLNVHVCMWRLTAELLSNLLKV